MDGNRAWGAVAACAVAAIVLTACVPNQSTPSPSASASTVTGGLTFVAAAATADVTAATLTLNGTDRVTWMSDRPDRSSGGLSTERFIDNWESYGFDADPPNAILDGIDTAGVPCHVALILQKPSIADDTIMFATQFIGDAPKTLPRTIEHAVLVIDSSSPSLGSSAPSGFQLIVLEALQQSSTISNVAVELGMQIVAGSNASAETKTNFAQASNELLDDLSSAQSQLQAAENPSDDEITAIGNSSIGSIQKYQNTLSDWAQLLNGIAGMATILAVVLVPALSSSLTNINGAVLLGG